MAEVLRDRYLAGTILLLTGVGSEAYRDGLSAASEFRCVATSHATAINPTIPIMLIALYIDIEVA